MLLSPRTCEDANPGDSTMTSACRRDTMRNWTYDRKAALIQNVRIALMNQIKSALWAIALGLTAVLLVGNAMLSYQNTQALVAGERASRQSREVLDAVTVLFSTMKDAETGQRGYLLSQDIAYLEPYEHALQEIMDKLGTLKHLLGDNPEQSARIPALEDAIVKKLDELKHTVEMEKAGQHSAAIAAVDTDQGLHLMADIRRRIDEICEAEKKLQNERDLRADQLLAATQFNRLLGMIIGLSLILLTVILLRRDLLARNRAANELFVQKEWLNATLRGIGDAVIVTDPHCNIVLLNPVAENLIGWSAQQAVGRPLTEVFDIVNETTRQRADDPVARAIASGKIVGLANHTVLRSRDGNEYVIEDSAAPTYDPAGKIQGAVMVFHDSTQRRQSELALATSAQEISRRAAAAIAGERTLNTILENAPIGISLTDASEGYPIVAMSRQMREWVGTRVGSRPTREAYRKLHLDGSVPALETLPLNRAMLTGKHVRGEQWIIERRDQPPLTVLVDVAPIRDADGEIVGAINIWIDITERRRLDHALRVTESRLHVLVRSNVIGLILHFDRDGKVRDANAALVEMLGFTMQDLRDGKINMAAITPREYQELDAQAYRELALGDACTPYEKELMRKNGTRISVVVGYARVADAENDYVGFVLDITHQKQLESQLRRQADQLRQADRRKDEFLAMLAHELRNPLAPLRNAVYLLESHRSDTASVDKMVPVMRRQIEHLVRLVDDLLDAARITQGKITLERQIVELQPILDAALETVQPLIQAHAHVVKLHIAGQSLRVDGDAARLTQMFANILNNAAKYTPPGGTIDVTLERESDAAVIRVKDTGQGIDASLLPRIFDIFIQADQSLARSSGGIGVGLALVRRLTELHGGEVSAFSAGADLGSEFVIRLPLATDGIVTAQGRSSPTGLIQSRSLRVLLVDDNVDLAGSTAALLELWGHSAQVAYNGNDALAAVQIFNPQVIILDIGLPEMDGFEVLRRLREGRCMTGVYTIAMTGYGQEKDKQRVREAGFDAHLVKPVQPSALKRLLDEL